MKMVADLEEQATLVNGTRIAYAKGVFVEPYRGVRTVYPALFTNESATGPSPAVTTWSL
jgi:hypothetical protein